MYKAVTENFTCFIHCTSQRKTVLSNNTTKQMLQLSLTILCVQHQKKVVCHVTPQKTSIFYVIWLIVTLHSCITAWDKKSNSIRQYQRTGYAVL
jgi:hypothetical protein